MKNSSFISRLRAWLNNIPIHDPVERRIASLLQIVLIGLIFVVNLATLVLMLTPYLSVQEKLNVLRSNFFGFLVVALPLGLLRRGYFRGSALIIISILFITPTLAVTVVFDLLSSGGILFQFTLAILLAGLLVSRRALALTFGLCAAVVGFAAFRGQNAALQSVIANLEMAVNFILFNGLIALFLDRFGVTLRAALTAGLERENELQNEVNNRKHAEETLRESEERYRELIAHARDVICTISADGSITSLSPSFEIFTGWSRAEWLGRAFDELVVGDDRMRAHDQFDRILRGEKLRALRLHMHTRAGEILVVEMNVAPQFKDDHVIGLLGIARDMTQEQYAENALRASEKRFRALIEHGWDAFTLADEQGNILYSSPSTERILGYTAEEFVGINAFTLFHSDDLALARSKLLEVMQTPRGIVTAEVRTRHKDGTWRWLEGVATNLCSEPDVQALVTNYRDITERKHAEAEFRESEARYRHVLDTMMEGCQIIDFDWRYLYVNEVVAAQQARLRREELINHTVMELYPGVEGTALFATLRQCMEGRLARHLETQFNFPDGRSSWFELSIQPVHEGIFILSTDITERKRAEEQIRYQASLLANINDAIIASDENQRITAWNSAAESMYGWKAEEVLGQSATQTMKTEFDGTDRAEVIRVLAETGTWRGEVTQTRKDGSRFYVETASISLRNAQGKIIGYVSVNRDITERKEIEETLRRSEERFRSLAENNWDGVALFGADGGILYASPSTRRIIGFDPDAIMGRNAFEFIHPDDQALVTEKLMDVLQQPGGSINIDARLVHKNGSWRWLEGVFTNLLNVPSVQAIVNNFRDVTERKKIEEKIQRQNQRLKALREIDTAILAADSVEKIVRVALKHIRELTDCRRASITLIDRETNTAEIFDVSTTSETSIPMGTRVRLAQFQDMIQILSKDQPVLINNLNVLTSPSPQLQNFMRDGLNSLCALPLFSQKTLIGVLSISSEIINFFNEEQMSLGREVANQVAIAITQNRLVAMLSQLNIDLEQRVRERENLITELTAKNAELERFTYTVSHDLKSPLVTMKGFLGYLEQDMLAGNVERLKGDTLRIANAVEKMQELLNDLLELSRIGRFVNTPESISFEELARSAVELVDGRLKEHGIAVQIQPDLPFVYGDRQRLTEVLQNLLDNAAKYMGSQPQPIIEIGQRGEERGLRILYVRDNGMGIPSEYHERVFGLFNKLDALNEGTGIGLALVRRIIEFHGGRIWVESELGQGSTFFFTLTASE